MTVGFLVAVLYGIPNRFPLREPRPIPITDVDRLIPFQGWTIWLYVSYFVLLFAPFVVCKDQRRVVRVSIALVLNSIVAAAIFVVLPTSAAVQEPVSTGLTGRLWSLLLTLDRPLNCLPSLHVANAVVCALALWRERRPWTSLSPVWLVLVVASTLTTKQHFVVDVLTGALLGLVADWCGGRVVDGPLAIGSRSWDSFPPARTRSHPRADRA